MKVPFLAFFPKSAQKACFLSQPFFPSLVVERRMNRHFRDLSPLPRIDVAKRREKERGKIKKEEKFSFFYRFLGRECCYCLDPLLHSKAPFRHDRAAKMGDQDLLFTSPILLPSVFHCCKEFNLAPKKRGERERGRDCRATTSASQERCLIMFFHQQKNFHNGRLANLILRRFTAVRDVRRPL